MYGKLIDGNLQAAPKQMKIGNCLVTNPTESMLSGAGYKPVRETVEEIPEGKMISGYTYTDEGDYIQRHAVLDDIPEAVDEPEQIDDVTLLKAQVQALSDRNDFMEDCIAEMAALVYA